uniref:Diguanylate cyclase/phosphodiesterase with PAS/PAC sensor(S) n=1 Tax=Rhodopseudomonas palustris (strain BisA53) TaxID=316055 RepID=Q07QK2_RHOP5
MTSSVLNDVKGTALRRTVKRMALAIALVIALGAPLGFGLIAYQYEDAIFSFKTAVAATRISRGLKAQSDLTRMSDREFASLVSLGQQRFPGRSRILDAEGGHTLYAEPPLVGFLLLTRRAPIVVGGVTVGLLEYEAQFDAMLHKLIVIALISSLLGACAYYTVRTLPLRALDRTLRDLDDAHRLIAESNATLCDQNGVLTERERELRAAQSVLKTRSNQLLDAQRLGRIGDWSYRVGNAEVWWAPELRHLLGYASNDFVSTRDAVMALHVGDGANRVLASQAEVMRTGKVSSVDVKLKRGDGTIGDFAVISKAMTNAEGRIVGFTGTIQDISERKAAEEQLERLAYYDPLTGLANRALFHREIAEVLMRSGRHGLQAALLLLDLDGFKEINDTMGHAAGDELLRKVAHLISRTLGNGDFLSRIGGDEFAIILTDGDRGEVERTARAIIEAISRPIDIDRGEINISTSIGIASMPRDGSTLTDVLRSADLALYRAKEDGRGCFRFFEPTMSAVVQHKMALSRDLRHALGGNAGLDVHYQPQIELSSGQVISYEALARWTHPSFGDVPPSEFIPIAESSNLICDLGLWVLRRAARQAKAWLDQGEPARSVAVNVSAAQIWHTDFAADVMQVLQETGLPPQLLCLELTESLLADHAEGRVRSVLTELKRLGVRLALDDFGTGYSSFGYLTQLPFDTLKIDRVFIKGIAHSDRARRLLQGVIALGRGLGMTILMEGVEQAEELAVLAELDCDVVQGYYLARPAAAADAVAATHQLNAAATPRLSATG